MGTAKQDGEREKNDEEETRDVRKEASKEG